MSVTAIVPVRKAKISWKRGKFQQTTRRQNCSAPSARNSTRHLFYSHCIQNF